MDDQEFVILLRFTRSQIFQRTVTVVMWVSKSAFAKKFVCIHLPHPWIYCWNVQCDQKLSCWIYLCVWTRRFAVLVRNLFNLPCSSLVLDRYIRSTENYLNGAYKCDWFLDVLHSLTRTYVINTECERYFFLYLRNQFSPSPLPIAFLHNDLGSEEFTHFWTIRWLGTSASAMEAAWWGPLVELSDWYHWCDRVR